jgi:predicted secreted Zn-dependent protease
MATQFGEVEWECYGVSGATLAEVAAAISHLPEAGSTEWFPRYEYETDEHGILTSATVTVGWRITLPHWDGYDAAGHAAQHEWHRFWTALEAHERGHLDIAEELFRDLEEHLVGKSAGRAQRVFDHAVHAVQTASDVYDRHNDHGRTEGTVIDVGVDAHLHA